MGFRVPKQPLEYHLVGACTFLSKDTIKALGYGDYKNLVDHSVPVLVYGKQKNLEDCYQFFIKRPDGSYKYIHPEIVKEYYGLHAAEEEFPELFI